MDEIINTWADLQMGDMEKLVYSQINSTHCGKETIFCLKWQNLDTIIINTTCE